MQIRGNDQSLVERVKSMMPDMLKMIQPLREMFPDMPFKLKFQFEDPETEDSEQETPSLPPVTPVASEEPEIDERGQFQPISRESDSCSSQEQCPGCDICRAAEQVIRNNSAIPWRSSVQDRIDRQTRQISADSIPEPSAFEGEASVTSVAPSAPKHIDSISQPGYERSEFTEVHEPEPQFAPEPVAEAPLDSIDASCETKQAEPENSPASYEEESVSAESYSVESWDSEADADFQRVLYSEWKAMDSLPDSVMESSEEPWRNVTFREPCSDKPRIYSTFRFEQTNNTFEIVCLMLMILIPIFAIGYLVGRRFAMFRRDATIRVPVPKNSPRSPRYSTTPYRTSILPRYNDEVAQSLEIQKAMEETCMV